MCGIVWHILYHKIKHILYRSSKCVGCFISVWHILYQSLKFVWQNKETTFAHIVCWKWYEKILFIQHTVWHFQSQAIILEKELKLIDKKYFGELFTKKGMMSKEGERNENHPHFQQTPVVLRRRTRLTLSPITYQYLMDPRGGASQAPPRKSLMEQLFTPSC